MGREWTREDQAEMNKDCRIAVYGHLVFWAAIGGIGPIAYFVCHNVLNASGPIARTFTGFHRDQFPTGDTYETYSYEYASPTDEALNILGFIIGLLAACLVAFLFYCLARFVADPLMYQIDLHTEAESAIQVWLKRIIMFMIVLLYCATIFFAGEYDRFPDEQYVWLSDGNGNEIRVDKAEYDKNNAQSKEDNNFETNVVKEETITTDDLNKKPVERGYPSNDFQYYVNHPDEPMPQEFINELMAPDYYSPGTDYHGY